VRTHTLGVLGLAAVLVLPLYGSAQPTDAFRPLLTGDTLDGWDAAGVERKRVAVANGVLWMKGKSGWLLLSGKYEDFVLRFEARAAPGSVGGVLLRMLPPEGTPYLGYELRVADGRGGGGRLLIRLGERTFDAVPDDDVSTSTTAAVVRPTRGDWQPFLIECRGRTLRALIDGQVVHEVGNVVHNLSRIGLSVERGEVEFRNIGIQTTAPSPLPGGQRPGTGGITTPRVLHEAKPAYTPEALKAKVHGEVLLECVVLPDGTVGNVTVVRPLSPDLDAAAIVAAKQWRFEPGTRDGQPVAVLVTISMGFTLK
jgi:TonB family protein